MKKKKNSKKNPVAKNGWKFNKAVAYKDKTVYSRKRNKKEE